MNQLNINETPLASLAHTYYWLGKNPVSTLQMTWVNCLNAIVQFSKTKNSKQITDAIQNIKTIKEYLSINEQNYPIFTLHAKDLMGIQTNGKQWVDDIKRIDVNSKEEFLSLIGRIQTIVKKTFPDDIPNDLTSHFAQASAEQNQLIPACLCVDGLAALYEIVFQMKNVNHELDAFKNLASNFEKVILSFQDGSNYSSEEGIERLKNLAFMIKEDKVLEKLDAPNLKTPYTASLKFIVLKLKNLADQDNQTVKTFYNSCKNNIRNFCQREGFALNDVKRWMEDLAKICGPKEDNTQIVNTVVNAFQGRQNQGKEDQLSGTNNPGKPLAANPFRLGGLDFIKSENDRRLLRESAIKIVSDYYEQRSLPTKTLGGSLINGIAIFKEAELQPESNLQAEVCFTLVLTKKFEDYRKNNQRLFELEESEKDKLAPGFMKEILLFGIKNDIFAESQLNFLFKKYAHNVRNDHEIIFEINAAKERRATKKAMEFLEKKREELETLAAQVRETIELFEQMAFHND